MHVRSLRAILVVLGLVALVVMVAGTTNTQAGVYTPALSAPQLTSSDVPLPSPTIAPPPPSPEISPEAQKALVYIAQREGIPLGNLIVANEFRRAAQLLSREFQAVTVLDQQSGRMFKVLVDRLSGQVEERAVIGDAQQQAYQAKYGKLQPALYERLQAIQATDLVTVTVWMADESGQSLGEREAAARAALAAKYPEARAAIESGGKPMDVGDPVLSEQISKEYIALVQAGVSQRAQALADLLKAQGFIVSVASQLPALTATLPKQLIQTIAQREDVGTIFLTSDRPPRPTLDTAVKTNRAPAVWARGQDGTGDGAYHPSIAIVDVSNVDFDDTNPGAQCPSGTHNCFQFPGATHTGWDTTSEHATRVASAAASNHSTYRGMAPGARIHSAGISWPGLFDQYVDALVWALGQDSGVVNTSLGDCNGREMQGIDWAYEFYARTYFRLLVVAAGNNDTCPSDPDDVTSPGLAWDVLTVGAYDDKNNADWSDDTMWSNSNWQNPFSLNGDREKPEVVAPGVNISMIGVNGQISTGPGTSLAAPQVAGEAALLIDRNLTLKSWPEANRAIIMATATNNIEGPTGIQLGQDLKDGAGGINADLADVTAQSGRYSNGTTCSVPCWWGDTITQGSFDASGLVG